MLVAGPAIVRRVAPMKRETILNRLRASADGSLGVFLVLKEDIYETKYGDGFYLHFECAFFSGDAAEAFLSALPVKRISCTRHADVGSCFETIEEPPNVASAYHVVPARVELRNDEVVATWSHPFETTAGFNEVQDIHERIVLSLPEESD